MNASPDSNEYELENIYTSMYSRFHGSVIFNKEFASDEIQDILNTFFMYDLETPNEDWDIADKLELLYQSMEKILATADKNTYEILDTFFTKYDGVTELFIPLERIITEIERINNSGIIKASPASLLNVYMFYLPVKLRLALMKKFKLVKKYDGKEITKANGEAIKFFKNQSNRLKNKSSAIQSEFDDFMVKLQNQIEATKKFGGFPDVESEKIIKDITSGKVESMYIIPLYNDGFINLSDNVTDRQKMLLLFDFFRTILPDRKWKTEGEFNKDIELDKAGFDNDYENYKYRTMRKFITKS